MKTSNEWRVGFWGALGCIVVGDAASIYCETLKEAIPYEDEAMRALQLVATAAWLLPLAGFVYFFFCKFWNQAEHIDAGFPERIRRLKYFLHIIVWGIVVSVVLTGIEFGVAKAMNLDDARAMMLGWLIQIVSSSVTTLVLFRYTIRRLHDMDWTCKVAKWQVLIAMLSLMGFMMPSLAALVIIAGFVPNMVLSLIVLFHGGTPGENSYGANPRNK